MVKVQKGLKFNYIISLKKCKLFCNEKQVIWLKIDPK